MTSYLSHAAADEIFKPNLECWNELQALAISIDQVGYLLDGDDPRVVRLFQKCSRKLPPEEQAARDRWFAVIESWAETQKAAQVFQESRKVPLLRRATWFFRALLSRGLAGHEVDKETLKLRVISCFGDSATPACPALAFEPQAGFHFCNDCGCGAREMARLSSQGSLANQPRFAPDDYVKLKYPKLACPRQRSGFINEKK